MTLKRKEAIVLLSFIEFLNSSTKERERKIDEALAEADMEKELPENVSNSYARKYIEFEFRSYSNDYLKTLISKHMGLDIDIRGKNPKFYPCPCCGYKTIGKRSEYIICKVCYWEDDGSETFGLDKYSSVNRMTLADAKSNFEKHGVVSINFLINVDRDRMIQFDRFRV